MKSIHNNIELKQKLKFNDMVLFYTKVNPTQQIMKHYKNICLSLRHT